MIRYGLESAERVRIVVFDVSGRTVRELVTGSMSAGEHQAIWDGRNDEGEQVSAGIFFVTLKSQSLDETRTVVRLR